MSSFDAYIDFCALKKHFTSTYDYQKYNGKLRRQPEAFEKRKDKYLFEKLGKKKDYHNFLLANISRKPKIWITDLIGNDDAEKMYVEWKKITQSLGYTFEQQIGLLPDDLYEKSSVANRRPALLHAYLTNKLCLETLSVLFSITNERWDDNPVWKEVCDTVSNYTPFLQFDKARMKVVGYKKFKHPIFLDGNNGTRL